MFKLMDEFFKRNQYRVNKFEPKYSSFEIDF